MPTLNFKLSFDSQERIEKNWTIFFENKTAGILKGYHRNSRDFFGHFCMAEFSLSPEFNTTENIREILSFISQHFFQEFSTASIALNENCSSLLSSIFPEFGFEKSDHLFLKTTGGFWILSAAKNKFTVIPFRKNILHVTDGSTAFSTIVIGKRSALVIDTLWGTTDFPGFLSKILKIPFTVVNTHGHPDHSFGNIFFDDVLLHPFDFPVYKANPSFKSFRDEKYFSQEDKEAYQNLPLKNVMPLSENAVFNLGDLTVQTIPLFGHTKGSLGFFVVEEKLLIAGDAVNSFLWLFMNESLNLKETLKYYEKAASYDFEYVISSHSKSLVCRKIIDVIIQNMKNILSGNYQISGPVETIIDYTVVKIVHSQDDLESSILLKADEYFLKN